MEQRGPCNNSSPLNPWRPLAPPPNLSYSMNPTPLGSQQLTFSADPGTTSSTTQAAGGGSLRPRYNYSLPVNRGQERLLTQPQQLSQAQPYYQQQFPQALPYQHQQLSQAPPYQHQHLSQAPLYRQQQLPQAPPHHKQQLPQASPYQQQQLPQAPPNHNQQLSQAPPFHQQQLSQAPPYQQQQLSQAPPYQQQQLSQAPPFHQQQLSQAPPYQHQQLSQAPPYQQQQLSQAPPYQQQQLSQAPPCQQQQVLHAPSYHQQHGSKALPFQQQQLSQALPYQQQQLSSLSHVDDDDDRALCSEEQRRDRDWVKKWSRKYLPSRSDPLRTSRPAFIKVRDFRKLLIEAVQLVTKLKQHQSNQLKLAAATSAAVPSAAVTSAAVPSAAVTTAIPSAAVTSAAVTSATVTLEAVTSAAVTSAAVTSAAVTSAAVTSAAVPSAAVPSAAVTSEAVTTAAVTSAAVAGPDKADDADTAGSDSANELTSTADVSVIDVQACKTRLKEIRELIDREEILRDIEHQLNKRKKKRVGQKRRRMENYESELERQERQKKLNEQLTAWIQSVAEKESAMKKDREIKIAADKTLSEVRQKLTESQRAIQVLTHLKRLRAARRGKALMCTDARGVMRLEEDDVMFEERLDSLEQLVTDQISLYSVEQQTLEVMLDMEQEEDLVRERIARRKKERGELLRYRSQINSQLFECVNQSVTARDVNGRSSRSNEEEEEEEESEESEEESEEEGNVEDDPQLSTYRQYYDAALNSLPALVQIRRQWDAYRVTDDGSSIPHGWVEPKRPCNSVWASCVTGRGHRQEAGGTGANGGQCPPNFISSETN